MKKRMLAALLALVMLMGALSATAAAKGAAAYQDVSADDWFYGAVGFVTENGLMTGTNTGFEPQRTTSRAMLWTILSRLDGQSAKRNAADWYAAAQLWAVQNDISDGTAPDAPITREQLASMLYRYAQRRGLVRAASSADLSTFADAAAVSAYAEEAVQWAVEAGLLNGMGGKLCPQGAATRAQVAEILRRMCEKWDILTQDNAAVAAAAAWLREDPEHTHGWTYTANKDGTHTATCTCGETKTEYCGFPAQSGTVTCPTCGFTTGHGVNSYEKLTEAIENHVDEIFITDDIEVKDAIRINIDTIIHGVGHTITINDENFSSKSLFENVDKEDEYADLTLDHLVIDGEEKERTNCLVLVKNNRGQLTISDAEFKNFRGTQIIASREVPGSVTLRNVSIHDNVLTTTDKKNGNEWYAEHYATLIWIQKNAATLENVTITDNVVDSLGGTRLGNGVLIYFRCYNGEKVGITAKNLVIENNTATRHIFATYETSNQNSHVFESGSIKNNSLTTTAKNEIFMVSNLTVGQEMTIECTNLVFNNDGSSGVCTLTNNGTIIGDIGEADWAVEKRGLPIYTGTGTHIGNKTNITVQTAE